MPHALDNFKPKISVVIPAYNEAGRLPATLRDVSSFMEQHVRSYEILVVDDGSTDQTVKVVRNLANVLPNVRLIESEKNGGKGAAVRRGLREATGDYRLFMDADHSTHISEIAKLPFLVERGDVFVSSRYVAGANVEKTQPLLRIIVSRIANVVIRTLIPDVRDTQNGFKIYSAAAVNIIEPQLTLDRWAFDVEMLYLAQRFGFDIVEFPVNWRNSTDSRLHVARDLKNTAREFAMLYRNILFNRYRIDTASVARRRQSTPDQSQIS